MISQVAMVPSADAPVEREQHAGRGRHALAALEAVEYRIKMAEERGHAYCGKLVGEVRSQPHRDGALGSISNEREGGGHLAAGAQHVGRAGVLRAVAARVGQAHQLAHQHRERDRPQAVGGEDGESRFASAAIL